MENKLTSKGMLLDICSMRSRAIKLLDQTNEYNSLLKCITDKDYYYDEDLRLPSLKDFAQMVNLKYDKARRQLKKIYLELCSLEFDSKFPFEFNETEIWVSLEGYNEIKGFTIKNLPYLPRVGEQIQVPYFKEYTGTNYYHVRSINHELFDNKHVILILLKYGLFSPYWNLRKDQAYEMGEISFRDSIEKNDYELRKLLNLRRDRAW